MSIFGRLLDELASAVSGDASPPAASSLNGYALRGRSGRLQFRNPITADLADLEAIVRDATVIAANGQTAHGAETEAAALHDPRAFPFWAAATLAGVHVDTGTVVGVASLSESTDRGVDALSIGLQMHPAHRRNGYGTELMAAMIAAIREVNDGPVIVATSVDNRGLRAIMAALGYQPRAGTQPNQRPNGVVMDTLVYDVGFGTPAPTFPPH